MNNWKPIDADTPKGIQVWLFGEAHTYDGYWRPNAMVIGRFMSGEWHITALGGHTETTIVPTLWQHLPELPTIL